MNYSEYFLYCVAVIVMIATPGPVMLLVASAGLKGGYKKALQTIFGTNLASLVLIVFSVLILKGALNINEQWLNAIKVLGCIYIAYIGLQVLKEAREAQPEQSQVVLPDTQGGFKQGLLVGISNPKDIIFFASFFPQFTGITADLNLSLSILTISWIILDFATLSLVYLAFNRLSRSAVYPKLLGICGAVLVVVALYGIYSALF
ncbi:LysE family translocator [Acinetobacter cumulans]|uniref:LysE family translocator n=1 Tax=Acinetobacter cumulans TaxID=2136182 RepID=A0A3A8FX84_9GAMM|nr:MULTISPECIES: LysE family translocator [Acinetobacter]NWK73864.1 LysE family translocator [Acinetobacter sp. SwsAc6]RFS36151.1 LysE family translocator [Acinetobacter sp. SWAC5]RKG46291.1 LysE family translocator [Acinetobacter cumulans]RKG51515.1 LysE family translocator [Acinetobacter cumulans]RLL47366.1 LysE family translocator [Acinetobacter cumulans]